VMKDLPLSKGSNQDQVALLATVCKGHANIMTMSRQHLVRPMQSGRNVFPQIPTCPARNSQKFPSILIDTVG
jgi:hypothetical protein